jgi:hypothetical protein
MGVKWGRSCRGRRRRKQAQFKRSRTTRALVFEREQHKCRVCRLRRADTMHELIPRSIGGKACLSNSVAVCGDGTRGCHGFCQRYEIVYQGSLEGAEGTLYFTPVTPAAAVWMRTPHNRPVERPANFAMEAA